MDHHKAEVMLSALGTVLDREETDPVNVVICGAMVLEELGHEKLAGELS